MQIKIDGEKCILCGVCSALSPAFTQTIVVQSNLDRAMEDPGRTAFAAASCPQDCITITP